MIQSEYVHVVYSLRRLESGLPIWAFGLFSRIWIKSFFHWSVVVSTLWANQGCHPNEGRIIEEVNANCSIGFHSPKNIELSCKKLNALPL